MYTLLSISTGFWAFGACIWEPAPSAFSNMEDCQDEVPTTFAAVVDKLCAYMETVPGPNLELKPVLFKKPCYFSYTTILCNCFFSTIGCGFQESGGAPECCVWWPCQDDERCLAYSETNLLLSFVFVIFWFELMINKKVSGLITVPYQSLVRFGTALVLLFLISLLHILSWQVSQTPRSKTSGCRWMHLTSRPSPRMAVPWLTIFLVPLFQKKRVETHLKETMVRIWWWPMMLM